MFVCELTIRPKRPRHTSPLQLRLSLAVSLSPVDELELDEDDEKAVLVAELLGKVDGEDEDAVHYKKKN